MRYPTVDCSEYLLGSILYLLWEHNWFTSDESDQTVWGSNLDRSFECMVINSM